MSAALVTGATSGIGAATALALADDGWWVLATGRDAERGRDIAEALGDRGSFHAADLADEAVADDLVRRATEGAGAPLGLLVNNAAVHFLGTIDRLDDDEWDRLVELNVTACMRLARAAVRAMGDRGGVIVNMASEAGVDAIPNQVAYNVSKAALVMLTRSLAADHSGNGIRAVSICPGTTRTPLVERAIASAADPTEHERQLASSRPMGRLAKPEEIAAAVVFAASEKASFITGTELIVDGGFTAT
jgi:meso-butanediol dehydrogenase / (S,S)-butanediol dehydrogenase / diacetyl reductase